MNVFTVIDDALALLRLPNGIYKEVKVYARQTRVYVPHGGGYVQVKGKYQSVEYSTSHPNVKVIELDVPGLEHVKHVGYDEPRYTGKAKGWSNA